MFDYTIKWNEDGENNIRWRYAWIFKRAFKIISKLQDCMEELMKEENVFLYRKRCSIHILWTDRNYKKMHTMITIFSEKISIQIRSDIVHERLIKWADQRTPEVVCTILGLIENHITKNNKFPNHILHIPSEAVFTDA